VLVKDRERVATYVKLNPNQVLLMDQSMLFVDVDIDLGYFVAVGILKQLLNFLFLGIGTLYDSFSCSVCILPKGSPQLMQ